MMQSIHLSGRCTSADYEPTATLLEQLRPCGPVSVFAGNLACRQASWPARYGS